MSRVGMRDELRVVLAPFATYRTLGQRPPPTLMQASLGPARWLAVIACVVSWTTSGALMLDHLLFSPLVWCFAPVVQGGVAVAVARRWGRGSAARALHLYYMGHAPWLIVLLLLSGICLVAPNPGPLLSSLLRGGAIPALMVAASVWSVVLTYAMFRTGLGNARRRAVAATMTHYVCCTVVFSSWFLFTGQLLPLWGVM